MINEIIDTHIHVWDLSKAEYSWLTGDTTILNRTYRLEELNTERIIAGITQGVLVQSANNVEDTDWMLQVAAENNWIKGVVGWLPLTDPGQAEKMLVETYHFKRYFKGVRHLIHNEQNPGWLLQDEVIESLRVLSQHNIPYDIVGILPEHIKTVLKVAGKVPGLRMVFDHLNQPPIAEKETFGQWGELMKQAAQHPGVHVKISGLGSPAKNPGKWTAEDIESYVEFVIDQFGEDRCFCGGDWPVCLLSGSYVNTWSIYKTVLSKLLSKTGLQKVLSANAARFYNL